MCTVVEFVVASVTVCVQLLSLLLHLCYSVCTVVEFVVASVTVCVQLLSVLLRLLQCVYSC